MTPLKKHLSQFSREARQEIAERCGTSLGYLTNVANGYKQCGPLLAAVLESEFAGAVTRRDLRPNDWMLIWPELAKKQRRTTNQHKQEA